MSSPPIDSPPGNDTTAPPPPPPPTPTPPPSDATSPAPPETNTTSPTTSPLTPPPPPPLTPTASPSGGMPTGTLIGSVIGAVLGGLLMLIVVGIFACIYTRRKRKRKQNRLGSHFFDPQDPKEDQFGGQSVNRQPNHHPPTDGKLTSLPKPTPPPGIALNPQLLPLQTPSPLVYSSASSSLGPERPERSPGIPLGLSQSMFTYDELAMATNGFSDSNLLGQGGFGYVHKGVLPNGKTVAVKQLKTGSGQGEREFQAEVEVISRVHHRHLVSLVGYCIAGEKRLLVYEYVPNNNLEFHLHGMDRPAMDWSTRHKIALDSAKGLAYLHEDCQPKIIHRDIKASNILLDYNFEAKVADFGLARFCLDTDTHVSTRVMGTFGYLAPEYAASGKLTEKSDIFSFGVVLLELITGLKPIDKYHPFADDSMVDWARPLLSQALENGNFDALVDLRLQKNYDSNEMTQMVACAAACVRHSARRRPRMSQVVRALEGNISLDDLNEGTVPGHSTVYSSYGSSGYDTSQYNEDLKKFKKLALESQGQGTSEYSGPSSEYGQHPSASSSECLQTSQETEPGKT